MLSMPDEHEAGEGDPRMINGQPTDAMLPADEVEHDQTDESHGDMRSTKRATLPA